MCAVCAFGGSYEAALTRVSIQRVGKRQDMRNFCLDGPHFFLRHFRHLSCVIRSSLLPFLAEDVTAKKEGDGATHTEENDACNAYVQSPGVGRP